MAGFRTDGDQDAATRIHDRRRAKQNFQGTFVVSGGGAVSSARIAHYGEGSIERIDRSTAESPIYRHNEGLCSRFCPGSRVAVEQQARR